jgi:hypothetical protein
MLPMWQITPLNARSIPSRKPFHRVSVHRQQPPLVLTVDDALDKCPDAEEVEQFSSFLPEVMKPLKGHSTTVISVAFSPDATSSLDKTRMWGATGENVMMPSRDIHVPPLLQMAVLGQDDPNMGCGHSRTHVPAAAASKSLSNLHDDSRRELIFWVLSECCHDVVVISSSESFKFILTCYIMFKVTLKEVMSLASSLLKISNYYAYNLVQDEKDEHSFNPWESLKGLESPGHPCLQSRRNFEG